MNEPFILMNNSLTYLCQTVKPNIISNYSTVLVQKIQRIAVQLNIPYSDYNVESCSNHSCVHGRCVRYFDDSKEGWFCQCHSEWTGRYCHIPHHCTCASRSLCIGKLANNRSLCVCPMNKWGSRCLLHDYVCRFNGSLFNNTLHRTKNLNVFVEKAIRKDTVSFY